MKWHTICEVTDTGESDGSKLGQISLTWPPDRGRTHWLIARPRKPPHGLIAPSDIPSRLPVCSKGGRERGAIRRLWNIPLQIAINTVPNALYGASTQPFRIATYILHTYIIYNHTILAISKIRRRGGWWGVDRALVVWVGYYIPQAQLLYYIRPDLYIWGGLGGVEYTRDRLPISRPARSLG